MARIFISRKLPLDLATALAGHEVSVFEENRPPTPKELAKEAKGCEALVSLLSDTIDEAFLRQVPTLKVVANYAVGFDNIDIEACRKHNVWVTNTPDVLTVSTAELTWALILCAAKRTREGEHLLRSGAYKHWSPTMLLGTELFGRTLGVFGYGRIGRAVATRAEAFGMRVIYTGRDSGVPFEQLLRESDVLTVHAPLTPDTHHKFDAKAFVAMRKTAFLVNTARGPLVREADLVQALATGEIAGAALDVYEDEPAVHSGLLNRDDVVLLPHLGSATQRARRRMAEIACKNALQVLSGEHPSNALFEL